MDKNKELADQIDRYLLQQMQEEELTAFRQKMENDSNLAKEVSLREDLAAGIRLKKNRAMKATLNQMHEELVTSKPSSSSKPAPTARRFFLYPLAAVASFLLLFFVYQTIQSSQPNTQELFATYYSDQPLNLASRNGTDDQQLLQIESLYKNKKYETVAPLIENLLENIAKDPTTSETIKTATPKLLLGAGTAALNLNQTESAAGYFQKIITLKDPFYTDHAHWYLALTYLQQDNLIACREQLSKLVNNPSADHYADAKELLSKL